MPVSTSSQAQRVEGASQVVRAPRGTQLSCKGWQQKAALRMLMNNLDSDVAEKPDELILCGGRALPVRVILPKPRRPCRMA